MLENILYMFMHLYKTEIFYRWLLHSEDHLWNTDPGPQHQFILYVRQGYGGTNRSRRSVQLDGECT